MTLFQSAEVWADKLNLLGVFAIRKNWCILILLLIIFVLVESMARAEDHRSGIFTSKDQENNINLLKQMSSSQIEVLSRAYPDFRILKICTGRFSGGDRDEMVLGIWRPVEPKVGRKPDVHRVGLIWNQNEWEVRLSRFGGTGHVPVS